MAGRHLASWASVRGADPLAATLSRVIQGGTGGNGGRLQHPRVAWRLAKVVTADTQQTIPATSNSTAITRVAVGPPPVGIYVTLEIRTAAGPSSAVQCLAIGGPYTTAS
jgi:hypothetical protein